MLRWVALPVLQALLAPRAFSSSPGLTVQVPLYTNHADTKVDVQLGVMSQCPDAIVCHRIFDQVLDRVGDKVDISLVFVAELDDEEPEYGAVCKHGPQECAGNVQQLCAIKYAPEQWWNFVHCQNFHGRGNIGTPDTAFKCARASGIDWETSGVGECAGLDGNGKGKEGIALLRDSILLGKALGIEKSCTVLINGEKVCVRDGKWKECEEGHTVNDFVRQIREEYERLNS